MQSFHGQESNCDQRSNSESHVEDPDNRQANVCKTQATLPLVFFRIRIQAQVIGPKMDKSLALIFQKVHCY